ncbi:MAG TPA: hypothetical protein PLX59_00810 [Candidatus Cloacimonadota bacterium]|nr:hypothetical protein [Candidatus Cloacimonadota bacterium]
MKQLSILLLVLVAIIPVFGQNRAGAFVLSAGLPGAFQISKGHDYGYAMLGAEIGLWGTLFFLSNEQKLSQTDYVDYAIRYAHISPGDYSQDYYSHLSRYSSSGYEAGGYNAMIRQQARDLYPYDSASQQQYIDANIYPEELGWQWESLANRREYNKIRIYNKNLKDYSKIATGVLVLNHLISTIDFLRYPLGDNSRVSFGFNGDKTMLLMDYKF